MADTAEDETVGKSTEISSLSSNDRVLAGLHTIPLSPKQKFGSGFLGFYLNSNSYHDKLRPLMQGIKVTSISKTNLKNTILQFPKELEEQKRIGKLFIKLNRTITLHDIQYCRHQFGLGQTLLKSLTCHLHPAQPILGSYHRHHIKRYRLYKDYPSFQSVFLPG